MSVVSQQQVSIRDEVVRAGAHLSASQYRLVRLVRELEISGEWAIDGSATCAHWIAHALDVEPCTARDWLRVGRALAELPSIDALFERGTLSYSKVRALTRVAKPETEVDLCELAERVSAGQLPCALATWLARRETPQETEARQREGRRYSWRVDVDGMIVGSYRLPPRDAAELHTSVDTLVATTRPDASADAWPSVAQQRADALTALARGGGGRVVTEVVLHVRGDGCTLDDGTPIASSVVERIAPHAFLRALIHDADRRPINASGRHRHPTNRQRRVVRERDRACVDCGSTNFLEYDHVPPFEITRRTIVDELRTRCWTCHHARHRRSER